MASAGDYSPIQTPFFWYPEYLALIKVFLPDFVFKCQDITYSIGSNNAEYVRHTWSYVSDSALKLASLMRSGFNSSICYSNNLTKAVFITYEPQTFMGGWITGTVMMVNDPTSSHNPKTKICKCASCKSEIQISINYYPYPLTEESKTQIMNDIESVYFEAQRRLASHFKKENLLMIEKKIQQIEVRDRLKAPKQEVVKPYVVMKTNIPEHMRVKDEDYFIESWM
jgi:hypothetical protein